MNVNLDCINCLVRQVVDVLKIIDITEKERILYAQEMFQYISRIDLTQPPPIVGRMIYSRIGEITRNADPYCAIKRKSNDLALSIIPTARENILNSLDPIKRAIQFSINGNQIDYGAVKSINEDEIIHGIEMNMNTEISHNLLTKFKKDIEISQKILFIGDNAGEIVFDMLFIEQLPQEKIVFATRGRPIINDSTMEDAKYIGLDRLVQVIDTGDNTPGIDLSRSSEEFLKEFKSADTIILKGQGNFETVFDKPLGFYKRVETPLYFFLKVKCQFVAEILNCNIGEAQSLRIQ
ncbi:MAG: ARMT1-like domain-containing protein [Spirochaetota bacterium]|nr:ARMT1-like domain-containing protein [Spirochaetota bacterium]